MNMYGLFYVSDIHITIYFLDILYTVDDTRCCSTRICGTKVITCWWRQSCNIVDFFIEKEQQIINVYPAWVPVPCIHWCIRQVYSKKKMSCLIVVKSLVNKTRTILGLCHHSKTFSTNMGLLINTFRFFLHDKLIILSINPLCTICNTPKNELFQ